MNTLDTTELVEEFGRYINQGQNANNLKKLLYEPAYVDQFFTKIPTKDHQYRSALMKMSKVLQAFVKDFTAKGDTQFLPHAIELGRFKIDDEFMPDDIHDTYVQFLENLDEKDRSKWPVVGLLIKDGYIPQANDEYENEVAYRGWKITGYNGTPTVTGAGFVREYSSNTIEQPANGAMDGIAVQMMKVHSRLNVIATGALETEKVAFCTQIEEFVKAIPRRYRRKMKNLFMDEAKVDLYREGRRAKYNQNWGQVDGLEKVEGNLNISVTYFPGMETSEKIWISIPENLVRPTHTENNGKFDVQKADRKVKLLTDWRKAIGFAVPELMWTNDQEATMTAGLIATYYTE